MSRVASLAPDPIEAERKEALMWWRFMRWTWPAALGLFYLPRWLPRPSTVRGVVLMFAGLTLLAALAFTARFVYSGVVVLVAALPSKRQGVAQGVIVGLAAALPLVFFTSRATRPAFELFEYAGSYWILYLGTTLIYGFIVYHVAKTIPPLMPMRSYLLAATAAVILSWATVAGIEFGADDVEGSRPAISEETDSPGMSNGDKGLINYARFILAGYAAVTLGLWRQGTIHFRGDR